MTRRVLALLTAGLLAASCGVGESGSDSEDSGPTTRRSTTSSSSTTSRPTDAGAVEVQVTDAGEGPATRLRLNLRKGSRTKLTVKVTSRLTQEAQGRSETTNVPPITEQLDLDIVDVDDQGTASYQFTLTDVSVEEGSVPPAQLQVVRESLRKIVGLTGSGRITDSGETLSSRVDIPPATPPEVRQVLQQLTDQFGTLSVPLPAEPVGRGARWTARSEIESGGARVALRTDYRLLRIDGDRVEMQVDQHQTAAPQAFRLPSLSPGTTSRIVDWDIRSTGVSTLDTSRLLPETRLETSGRQAFAITVNKAKPQTLNQDLSATTEVTATAG